MFQTNYNTFNAITFFLVFLIVFEVLCLASGRASEGVKPQIFVLVMSLGCATVAGFDDKIKVGPRKLC